MKPLTVYQRHVERYRDCRGCELCRTRERVVFPRGSVPADVVFVGEAPGESENILGTPFSGPAGQLLDGIVDDALGHAPHVRVAFTNLVLCIPYSPDGVGKTEEPDADHVIACSGRLGEFLRIARPRLVVAVGAYAKKWLAPGYRHSVPLPDGVKLIDVVHPAAVLRANVAQRGLMRQRCVVQIRQAVEELEHGPIPY